MRLAKIKLAGFKSFVDPTTVTFPANLTGVVGPNGCGKSNIIDAVRWVMGEISAKHLRGDSMADVIFNGSSSRKPVGTASVELVFDNSDGQLGGQYASFAEVSLKRIVSRDGTSAYFLNGTRCRRKDITQLFLGTGLGSRSYAIIEQGMISRIIDAKPDELRGFVEEAAGISKYKERRRETENRISHTKENLERLSDVREEVEKQLRHLQRQAATARRYQALKQDERRVTAELLALKLREIDTDSQSKAGILRERDTRLQAAIADQRAVESEIETARSEYADRSEALNEVQGRYYQAGAEISRTEQAIQHAREIRHRQRTDLDQVVQGFDESTEHLTRDQAQIDELAAALAALGPELERARQCELQSAERLDVAEQAMQAWQERWEEFNTSFRGASEKTHAERARIEQLENQLHRTSQQRERLATEVAGLTTTELDRRIGELATNEEDAQRSGAAAGQQLEQLTTELNELRERERRLATELDRARREAQERQGRLVSLEALQQAALGRAQGNVMEWLQAKALQERPRLAEQLSVEPGWERAIETVLGSYLEAVCVDGIDSVADVLGDFAAGTLTFFSAEEAPEQSSGGEGIAALVRGPAGVAGLLEGVFAVETLAEGLARRSSLQAGESVITRDGVWIGRDWLRVSRDQDVHAGVIEREQEIRSLKGRVQAAVAESEQLDAARVDTRDRLREIELRRDEVQAEVNRLQRVHGDLRAQLG
ncbi:MAG TPA: chromosome segregation protein SMC, partial [Steroidobacteraceae bacterium]|nr:chromosome segregation protein SMC [Steroidobacteraceae bacterium]